MTLQIRILVYFRADLGEDSRQMLKKMGIATDQIILSIVLAAVHALFEFTFLAIEAQASKTSFFNYCIICFNGRFNWVPYTDYLAEGIAGSIRQKTIDYSSISTRVFCVVTSIEFHFTDITLQSLIKTIVQLPK